MKRVVICACALGALTLAACQRPAAEPEAQDAAVAADTAAVDTAAAENTAAATGAADAPRAAAMAEGSSSEGSAGAETGDVGAMASSPSGVSQATRDTAKTKAEETNLHP